MAGQERTTIDIMFFKYFKKQANEANTLPSRWLYFNRNRASIDYRMTSSSYLPQFGFTEAISYNYPKSFGFAPVLVGQILSSGVFSKAGIQYAIIRPHFTLFSWLVCETKSSPNIDYFLLIRFTPKLTNKTNLFSQLESVNTLSTKPNNTYGFSQRLRLGLQLKFFQFGVGADFSQALPSRHNRFYNLGVFLRYEF